MHGYGSMWPMGGMMFGWLVLTVVAVAVVVWTVVSFTPRGPAGTTPAQRGGSSTNGTPAASWTPRSTPNA